jgi:hypothetical protein
MVESQCSDMKVTLFDNHFITFHHYASGRGGGDRFSQQCKST